MSQAVLALHCPTKEDYLTVLNYLDRKYPSFRGLYSDGGCRGILYPSDIHYPCVVGTMDPVELCAVLRTNEKESLDLSWHSLEYCRKEGYMIIPAVNFRTDQSTIPSRMCQEDAEKGESNE